MVSDNLARVAEVACEGDFQQAFEGATLIEQVESVENEKTFEAQVVVESPCRMMQRRTSSHF